MVLCVGSPKFRSIDETVSYYEYPQNIGKLFLHGFCLVAQTRTVRHFHLLSKQWSCDRLGLGFFLRAARVHTHHTFTQHANAM